MPQVINITSEDIHYAEKILLPEGKEFDDERKAFIRNFDTIDLQAVPGSGKTTVLLAKLLILERYLPFQDGSGVLIISHTNAAIDEIKHKIQKHCPKLFSYPNFIGTIQSFVDEFLAIPFYISKYKKKPSRIDNEIYNEKIEKCLDKLWLYGFGFNRDITTKVSHLKNTNEALFFNYRFNFDNGVILTKKMNDSKLEINKPHGHTRTENYIDYTDGEKELIYKWFFQFKNKILEEGILHFDDAYFLANVYLTKFPAIGHILQKRFGYVFVDEMQDMDSHQYNLLEKIFYNNRQSISVVQRIGDRNQAIYNSSDNLRTSEVWQLREGTHCILNLTGSQRLSNPIAKIVKRFAIYNDANFDIIGLNECSLKPHILIFENENINNVIPFFARIVTEYKQNGSLVNSDKDNKIICWNTEWKENEASRQDSSKIRLEDYYVDYKKERGKPKQDYDCLKSYLLFYDKNIKTLGPLRKNILNAFLKILRLENINTADTRSYTKKKLVDFIRDVDQRRYDELNLNIYKWSMDIVKGKVNNVWAEIKIYVPNLFEIFSQNQLSTSLVFLSNDLVSIPAENITEIETKNCYKEDGVEIEITSVHAVKGQTHCATLYLESYFQKDGTGASAKSYESQRLSEQFLGNTIQANSVGDRVRQSAKMAYVGFSRPSDLLCIAVHKDRFDSFLSTINRDEWEIVYVSN